jgi:hypothetical protein
MTFVGTLTTPTSPRRSVRGRELRREQDRRVRQPGQQLAPDRWRCARQRQGRLALKRLAMTSRTGTKIYGAMPASIQRWKTLIFSALQDPSHGIDPSRRRSTMAAAWDLTSV